MTLNVLPSDRPRLGLALRYRPSNFAQLAGQRHVAAVLSQQLRAGTYPPQILLSGESGLGKTTVARIAAAAILCQTPVADRDGGDACGSCDSCLDVTQPGRLHPDLIEFDAASHGGKDEIRDIASRAQVMPVRGARKIYIIDEAHGLTGPGGQAFLKLLEEPPAHVVFILATTDPQKMAKANRGRCMEFELLRPTDEELVANLLRVAAGEGWALDPETAHMVVAATRSELGVRGTLMTLEKLSPAFADGQTPDAVTVAALLGVAPAEPLRALTAAIGAGDGAAAHAALLALRAVTSETSIRAGLSAYAAAEYRTAASANGSARTVALYRLEKTASLSGPAVFTDLAVAAMAEPHLDVHGAPHLVVAAANETLEQLRAERAAAADMLRTLAAQPAPTSAPASPAPAAAPPATQPAAAKPTGPAAEKPSGSRSQPARRAAAAGAGSDVTVAFAASVRAANKRAAAILSSTTLTVDGSQLTVTGSASSLAALAKPGTFEALTAAAQTHHLTLELVTP